MNGQIGLHFVEALYRQGMFFQCAKLQNRHESGFSLCRLFPTKASAWRSSEYVPLTSLRSSMLIWSIAWGALDATHHCKWLGVALPTTSNDCHILLYLFVLFWHAAIIVQSKRQLALDETAGKRHGIIYIYKSSEFAWMCGQAFASLCTWAHEHMHVTCSTSLSLRPNRSQIKRACTRGACACLGWWTIDSYFAVLCYVLLQWSLP